MFQYFFADDDTQLEYFIQECGDILGIQNKLSHENRSAKHILEHVLHQVVEFKKLNQVGKSGQVIHYVCFFPQIDSLLAYIVILFCLYLTTLLMSQNWKETKQFTLKY